MDRLKTLQRFRANSPADMETKVEGGPKIRAKSSIEDDFMYGSNVATAHVYIRLGKNTST